MTVSRDRLTKILLEVTLGVSPEKPDTPEEAARRAQYKAEVDEIGARGGIVEIPGEIP